jgi:hypothetical protein
VNFDFEMNPQGLGPAVLEYLPENRSTTLDGSWPNSGTAPGFWWDLNGGHFSGDGVTQHFWKREVYTNKAYAAIEEGQEEIDLPTWHRLWTEQLGGKGPSKAFTYAWRIGDLDNIGGMDQYIQGMVELTNAEYSSVASTVPLSIDRMWPGYMVRNRTNDRVIQQNGARQSPDGGGWGTDYFPPDSEPSWENTVFIITGQIGSGAISSLWINGVEVTPGLDVNLEGLDGEWDVEVLGEEPLTWVDEFNTTWGAEVPYPNRYTAQGALSPANADVDAVFTLMEGCVTLGLDSPPSNNNNGLTHMAFYRGVPTPSDIARITAAWS